MSFSSIEFFVFYFILLSIMLLTQVKKLEQILSLKQLQKLRHIILLIASYLFYGWWDWRFCFLMLFVTLIAYISAKRIYAGAKDAIFFRFAGVVIPLLVLGVFKYFNFFVSSFYALFGLKGMKGIEIILPVGISFFIFQSMSYTIDVMRGKESPHSFQELALYISFFPQLVAGPIVKASEFFPQLKESRSISLKRFEAGIQIFVFGLFKKIVLADQLSVYVDEVFATPAAFSALTLILAVLAYSLQILFDFSGYSDMAIGCAKILGYDFSVNFDLPYISKNLTEFWKRWHISLSSWLQQYLCFPLGGNKKGRLRTYTNLMLTMTLGGLWHGASWNFVIWGILHGIGLCIHKGYTEFRKKKKESNFVTDVASVIMTYLFVCLCWIFFRSDDLSKAFLILKRIITWQNGVTHIFSWLILAFIILIIATISAQRKSRGQRQVKGYYPIMDLTKIWSLTIFFIEIGMTLGLAYVGNNPFIYFQF